MFACYCKQQSPTATFPVCSWKVFLVAVHRKAFPNSASLSLPRNSSQLCCWDVSTSGSSHTGLCIPREPASTNQKPAFANVIGLGQSGGRISGWNGPRADLDGCLPLARLLLALEDLQEVPMTDNMRRSNCPRIVDQLSSLARCFIHSDGRMHDTLTACVRKEHHIPWSTKKWTILLLDIVSKRKMLAKWTMETSL